MQVKLTHTQNNKITIHQDKNLSWSSWDWKCVNADDSVETPTVPEDECGQLYPRGLTVVWHCLWHYEWLPWTFNSAIGSSECRNDVKFRHLEITDLRKKSAILWNLILFVESLEEATAPTGVCYWETLRPSCRLSTSVSVVGLSYVARACSEVLLHIVFSGGNMIALLPVEQFWGPMTCFHAQAGNWTANTVGDNHKAMKPNQSSSWQCSSVHRGLCTMAGV